MHKSVQFFTAKYAFLACYCILHLNRCPSLPQKEMTHILIHFCDVLPLSRGKDADIRLVEVRQVKLKLRLGAGKIVLL